MGVNYNFLPNDQIIPDMSNPNYISPMGCGHPNENGYAVVADRMFNIISNYDPTLINSNLTQVIYEREWRDAKKWYKKHD
jgi:hypothetical protein